MKRNVQVLKEALFLIFLLIVFDWIVMGNCCALVGEGRVTKNVNLREAPGLDRKIILVLKRGLKVTLIEKNGDWYQVVTKGEQTEKKGWIFGQYLKVLSEKVEPTPAPPQAQQEEKTPEPAGVLQKEVSPNPEATKALPGSAEGYKEAKILPVSGGEKTAETPRVSEEMKKGEGVITREEEKNTEALIQSTEITPPQENLPKVKKTESVQNKEVDRKVTPGNRDNLSLGASQLITGFRKYTVGLAALIAIVLSGLAILFAYQANRKVRECYQAMIRFQMRWQNSKENEWNEEKK